VCKYLSGQLESTGEQTGGFETGPEPGDDAADEAAAAASSKLKPRKRLRPLLVAASDMAPPAMDWVGVSFGLTLPLFEFWSRAGFVPVYCRQTAHESTGSHTCMMLKGARSEPAQVARCVISVWPLDRGCRRFACRCRLAWPHWQRRKAPPARVKPPSREGALRLLKATARPRRRD